MIGVSAEDDVRQLVEPALRQLGLELLQVVWHPAPGHPTLRLTVDRPGGVTVDECGRASEAASALLDRLAERFPDSYSLEVSSPGAERPLRSDADFRAALGRRVRVVFRQGEAETRVEGRLTAVSESELELEHRPQRGRSARVLRVERGQLRAAQVVVDL
ncbi:MAG: ribosome maturation factor RimP [Candidatus Dormibacteria bacterium]